MKIRNNTPSFGARVKINYKQLRGLGETAIEVAEKVKPILERKSKNLSYEITRAYKLNPDYKHNEFLDGLVIATNKILVVAKRINATPKGKVKNLFRIYVEQTSSTPVHTEKGIFSAARRAARKVNESKSENVFVFLGKVLAPPGDFGPH